MSEVCKCCGQTLPEKVALGIKLAPGEQLIVDSVVKAGQHGLHSDRLFNILYGDDPNGGPSTGINTLHVRVWHLNRKLRTVGYTIKGEYPGKSMNGRYRLHVV